MLATQRNAGRAVARYLNIVDEAGEWRNGPEKEGDNGTPIGCVLGRVAIDAVKVIHIGHRDILTSDNKVAVK